jgi:hypothetical protein
MRARPKNPLSRVSIQFLLELIRSPDFRAFREHFDHAVSGPLDTQQRQRLRSVAADAFLALLETAHPDRDLLIWFAGHYDRGDIEPSERLAERLAKYSREITRQREARRRGELEQSANIIQTKRVIQMSWFGLAGWQSSDAFQIKTSVFRSQQERTFMTALRLRFPHLDALPNYPLDQLCDLNRLRSLVGDQIWRYGLHCRIDTVLITPREGDPVAAFELDSRMHDEPVRQQRDSWRNRLLMLANIPFFRLRSEDPNGTSAEEWYQLLTDEVAHKVNVGERLRNRDVHSMLVPLGG